MNAITERTWSAHAVGRVRGKHGSMAARLPGPRNVAGQQGTCDMTTQHEIDTPQSAHEAGRDRLRQLLGASLGQVLTPELATDIELAASALSEPLLPRVERLQQTMEHLPQVDCPVRHHFAPGIYAREINITAGTVVVGAMHKTQNLIVVSKGRLLVATEEGACEVSAGDTLVCRPGKKNAVLALEDARWTNFHANPDDETDLEVLTQRFTHTTADELMGGPRNAQLLQSGAGCSQLEN